MKSFSLIWCITSLTGGISFLLIPSNLSWSQLRVSTATNSSIKYCSRWIKLICYISATVLIQTRKYYIFPNDVTFDKNCTLTWYLSQWGRLLNNIFRLIKIYISLIDSLIHSLTHSLSDSPPSIKEFFIIIPMVSSPFMHLNCLCSPKLNNLNTPLP